MRGGCGCRQWDRSWFDLRGGKVYDVGIKLDSDERREAIESAGLDPDDYEFK